MWSLLWKGTKAIAAGRTQANLGLQSPHLPGAIVRIGRFGFTVSGLWISTVWYTAFVNMRTKPGSGPQLLLKGKVIGPPDRPNRDPKFASGIGNSATVNPGTGGGSNPFPGATGSRLDQGFDLTSQHFQAPADSVIIYVSQNDPGWKGGGLVAGRILSGPKKGMVWYMAEGLSPIVNQGQNVRQGDVLARPKSNPYNGIVGNIEAGWANPAAPNQPLAQIANNPASVAWDFYRWIQSLGGPKASSTGNAGRP